VVAWEAGGGYGNGGQGKSKNAGRAANPELFEGGKVAAAA